MLVGAAFQSRAVAAFCCRLLHARTFKNMRGLPIVSRGAPCARIGCSRGVADFSCPDLAPPVGPRPALQPPSAPPPLSTVARTASVPRELSLSIPAVPNLFGTRDRFRAPPGSASVHRGPTMVDLVEAARVRGPRAPSPSVHRFHHFLVLDFEATCDKDAPPRPQEIIEFPILRVNGKSMEVESTFHTYVRPTAHPELSAFCTELTGIVQDMVDGRPTLDQVLQVYAASAGRYAKGIADMMAGLNLQHEGRLHSGIDDCKNIAAILKELARRGATLEVTAQL
ncbi:ERI1 exoribonuclease 3 isoform X2 [Petromyzon marinus]|uniref:ERI1 exoribonuclease 3 isoform X2 n=1 Tax=Petromyzon marinus TaxID=7757 RepID=UPI003F7223C2